jgi:hypothetical protein
MVAGAGNRERHGFGHGQRPARMPGRCQCFEQALFGGVELGYRWQRLHRLREIQEAEISIDKVFFRHVITHEMQWVIIAFE